MAIQLEFFEEFEQFPGFEQWNILQDGEPIGFIILRARGDTLHISNINADLGRSKGIILGPAGVRQVLRQLKKEFPLVTNISGTRITGARTSLPLELQEVKRRI